MEIQNNNLTKIEKFYQAAVQTGVPLTVLYYSALALENSSWVDGALAVGITFTAYKLHQLFKWQQPQTSFVQEMGIVAGMGVTGIKLLAYYLPLEQLAPAMGWSSIAIGALVAGLIAANEQEPRTVYNRI